MTILDIDIKYDLKYLEEANDSIEMEEQLSILIDDLEDIYFEDGYFDDLRFDIRDQEKGELDEDSRMDFLFDQATGLVEDVKEDLRVK